MTNKLLIEQVKQALVKLRLNDMADNLDSAIEQAEKAQQGYLQFFAELLNKQVEGIRCRSLVRRLKKAELAAHMTFESFDWNFQSTLDVPRVKDLTELGFLINRQPILILGKTGTGKTHIASALGIRACQAEYRGRFYSLQKLLKILYGTLADDSTDLFLAEIARLDMLIIDNVGHIRTKLEYPSLLFDLVNICHHRVAIIITSSISFQEWGEILGNPSLINAVIDRLMDKAHIINITKGRSFRTEGPNAPELEHAATGLSP